jgi:hypothetical protein
MIVLQCPADGKFVVVSLLLCDLFEICHLADIFEGLPIDTEGEVLDPQGFSCRRQVLSRK